MGRDRERVTEPNEDAEGRLRAACRFIGGGLRFVQAKGFLVEGQAQVQVAAVAGRALQGLEGADQLARHFDQVAVFGQRQDQAARLLKLQRHGLGSLHQCALEGNVQ